MSGWGVTWDRAEIEAFAHRLNLTYTRGKAALAEEAHRECEEIMADSKLNYVPVALGTLRDSGTVDPPEIRGDEITVLMYFGGPAEAYALAVHEHLSGSSPSSWVTAEAAGHPVQFHPAGHGAKYLEKPALAHEAGMEGRMASHMANKLERL